MENKRPQTLKTTSEFKELKDNGQVFKVNHWMKVSFLKKGKQINFGMTFSKKIGSAVIRNKLKRWTREFFRDEKVFKEDAAFHANIILKPVTEKFYKELESATYKKALAQFVIMAKQGR